VSELAGWVNLLYEKKVNRSLKRYAWNLAI